MPSKAKTKAQLSAEIVIVGAAVSGLAAAFTLARSGHRVRVLEKFPARDQRSNGVFIPPNLTTVLSRWGLDNVLEHLQPCRVSSFLSLETGELIGQLGWHDEVIKETGGEYYLMHYHDLTELLYKLAADAGAKISYGHTVANVGIHEVSHRPFVVLQNGEQIVADLVIGADGGRSVVREFVTQVEDQGRPSGQSLYCTTLSREEMETTSLASWIDNAGWPMFMGEGRAVLGYPIRHNTEYCLNVSLPDEEVEFESEESWTEVVPSDALHFNGLDLGVANLCHTPRTYVRTKVMQRPPLDAWSDDTGQIVLIGEAAHYSLPCTMQNSTLAIEDAEVLGVLFSKLHSKRQIPLLTEALQDLREERCAKVIAMEERNAVLVTMSPGPERDGRDAQMKLSLTDRNSGTSDEVDEEQLKAQWESVGSVFAYNAADAAEDWWIKWGSLGSRNEVGGGASRPQTSIQMEVTSRVGREEKEARAESSGRVNG